MCIGRHHVDVFRLRHHRCRSVLRHRASSAFRRHPRPSQTARARRVAFSHRHRPAIALLLRVARHWPDPIGMHPFRRSKVICRVVCSACRFRRLRCHFVIRHFRRSVYRRRAVLHTFRKVHLASWDQRQNVSTDDEPSSTGKGQWVYFVAHSRKKLCQNRFSLL